MACRTGVTGTEVRPSLKAREGQAGVVDGVILAAAQARLKALQLLRLQEAVLVDVQHAVQQIDLVWPDLRTRPHTQGFQSVHVYSEGRQVHIPRACQEGHPTACSVSAKSLSKAAAPIA